MEPATTAALIGAGGALLSGFLGQSSARKDQARYMAFQRELAQNNVFWRVQDAKRAGISPLAALGASPIQASWSPVGNQIGEGIAGAAGNVANGIMARQAAKQARLEWERDLFERNQRLGLDLERGNAEIELIKAQTASTINRTLQDQNHDVGGSLQRQTQNGDGVRSQYAGQKFTTPGGSMRVGPHTPADTWANEYGDLVESAVGAWRLGYDWLSDHLDKHGSVLDRYIK